MLIPKHIINPFGYPGIPTLRKNVDPDVIGNNLKYWARTIPQHRWHNAERLARVLERAIIALGAEWSNCEVVTYTMKPPRNANMTIWQMKYTVPGDQRIHDRSIG